MLELAAGTEVSADICKDCDQPARPLFARCLKHACERERFENAFTRWLMVNKSSCWERDVLRECKQQLWKQWLFQVGNYPKVRP